MFGGFYALSPWFYERSDEAPRENAEVGAEEIPDGVNA